MKKLILLSDLWGKENTSWLSYYTSILQKKYEIQWLDSQILGEITYVRSDTVHQQFLEGGIDRAVENLKLAIKKPVDILAFSIGGTIAWKAALEIPNIQKLVAISSTRLRLEVSKPLCNIQLYYGAEDKFRPQNEWFTHHNITCNLIANEEHDCYKKQRIAQQIGFESIIGIEM